MIDLGALHGEGRATHPSAELRNLLEPVRLLHPLSQCQLGLRIERGSTQLRGTTLAETPARATEGSDGSVGLVKFFGTRPQACTRRASHRIFTLGLSFSQLLSQLFRSQPLLLGLPAGDDSARK